MAERDRQEEHRLRPFRQLAADSEAIFRQFIDGQDGLDADLREQGVQSLRASREQCFGRVKDDPPS